MLEKSVTDFEGMIIGVENFGIVKFKKLPTANTLDDHKRHILNHLKILWRRPVLTCRHIKDHVRQDRRKKALGLHGITSNVVMDVIMKDKA